MNVDAKITGKTKKIKLLLLDVDGILTSGSVHIFGDNTEMYTFNVQDGYGIKLWRRAGFKIGFITGRHSDAVEHRAKKLGVDYLYRNVSDKVAICENIIKEEGLSMGEVAFMGDDLQDLALLRRVGLAVTVPNARDEIKQEAHIITESKGGEGAVRDVIELLLKEKGLWEDIIGQDRILS